MSLAPSIPDHMDHLMRESDILSPLKDTFGFEIGEFGKPRIIPGKQYQARVDIPLRYRGETATLITLAFKPGDGTGDMSTYREGQLDIPLGFRFLENPSRVYPRAKNLADGSPLPIEGMIPLFVTKVGETWMIPHNSTLLELGIVGENAIGIIGKMQTYSRPSILLTVTGEGEERYGDPHAIFSPREPGVEDGYQVAGFISANSRQSKVYELLKNQGKLPPSY
ncbi:MAG: hypothetical protein HHAS10_05350 [Candidatus Altimarinota bacterium]